MERDGIEVDAVLETADGRVAGFEVKAGAERLLLALRSKDSRQLRALISMRSRG